MTDATDKFLDVTQAAEKMYDALSELKQQTEDYSEAGQRLESAAARAQALADATTQVLEEQGRRWNELKQVLDDQVRPALDRLSDNADKQTVHLSSLSGAVAGQQSQLVQIQQGLADNMRAIHELRPAVAKLQEAAEEHGSRLSSLAEAAADQSKVLRQQSDMLADHTEQLTGTRDDLRDQRGIIRDLTNAVKRCMYAAVVAAALSLAVLIVVLII